LLEVSWDRLKQYFCVAKVDFSFFRMNANRSGGGNTRPRKRRRGEDGDDDDGIDAVIHMIRELAEAERRLEILQRENLRRILANLPVRNTLKIHVSDTIMKFLLVTKSGRIRPQMDRRVALPPGCGGRKLIF